MQKLLYLLRPSLFLMLLVSLFYVKARGQDLSTIKINAQATNVSIKEALQEIQKKSGIKFIYGQDLNQYNQLKVSFTSRNSTVEQAIDQVLQNTDLRYTQQDDHVLIDEKPRAEILSKQGRQKPGRISGKVTDTHGNPLNGATVQIPESKQRTTTRPDGTYGLLVQPGTYRVEISYLSFAKQTATGVKVTSSTTTRADFTLVDSVNELEEVQVTTALGIKREEKSLGYAATVLSGRQLTEALSNNWTEALSGKVAGLQLIRSNGGPAGSNKIILRGENNLSGGNDALIVVDGVVINGGSGRSTGYSEAYLSETSVDYGTSLNDINPDDIADLVVLKGPGAAALYGSRGANGAIVITTKTGHINQKGLGITVNSNTSFETINRVPSLQYEYGQGDDGAEYYSYAASEDGAATRSTTKAFGPKFDGQYFYQYDPLTHAQGTTRTPWVPYKKNGFNDFFVPAKTYTNGISVDGGTDKTSARFSYTRVDNSWIVPNTGYDRNTVAMSVNSKATKNLQITSKINYTNKHSANLPAGGYNNQSIMYGYIFWQPSASIDWLRDYWMPGQTNLRQSTPLTGTPDNPYFISYEMLNTQTRNSITGNIAATYTISNALNLMVRTSIDYANDGRSQQRPYDTQKFPKGMYRTQDILSQELNSDFLLKYHKQFDQQIDISASLGGSILRNNYSSNDIRADSLLYPGVFTMANAAGILAAYPYKSRYAINSLYGLVTAGYKDIAFVDFTLRNDWSSLLATPTSTDNVSILYPSVNASLILSGIFHLPAFISYAKLRGSLAGVGSGGTTPYRTSYTYSSDPLYTGGGLYNPTTLANTNLRPLYTKSYETGIDVKFFDSRIGMDLALYTEDTKDQILTSTVDRASGMSAIIVNAGVVRNKGIEIALNGSPFQTKDGFSWTISGTFSANNNTVVSLGSDLSQLTLQNGPGSNGYIIAKVGGSMGALYGRGYDRAPDGQIIYENGFPMLTDSLKYLGNTMPKWKAGLSNQFKYKNFSLSVLMDAQYGSVAYSLTQGKMAVQGKTKSTLPGRYNGIVGNGVVRNPDGTYSPNEVVVDDLSSYYDAHFGTSNVEGSTFSTKFIKLREARLDYAFRKKTLKALKLQNASIGLYGRDLFILSEWPGFDPEFGTLSGSDINRGFEIGQFPSTRSFGINLTVGL